MHWKLQQYCEFMSNNQCTEVVDFDSLSSEIVTELEAQYGTSNDQQSNQEEISLIRERYIEGRDRDIEEWFLLYGIDEEEETESFRRRATARYGNSGSAHKRYYSNWRTRFHKIQ